MMGSILVAFVGLVALGGNVEDAGSQFLTQVLSVGFTALWSVIGTIIVVLIIKATTGLRVSEDEENRGLDQSSHGETAYTLD